MTKEKQNSSISQKGGCRASLSRAAKKARFSSYLGLARGCSSGCALAAGVIGGWFFLSLLCEMLHVWGAVLVILGLWCFACIWEQRAAGAFEPKASDKLALSPRADNGEGTKANEGTPSTRSFFDAPERAASSAAAGKGNCGEKAASWAGKRTTVQKHRWVNTQKKREAPPHSHSI